MFSFLRNPSVRLGEYDAIEGWIEGAALESQWACVLTSFHDNIDN